jgi:hypothetical protein
MSHWSTPARPTRLLSPIATRTEPVDQAKLDLLDNLCAAAQLPCSRCHKGVAVLDNLSTGHPCAVAAGIPLILGKSRDQAGDAALSSLRHRYVGWSAAPSAAAELMI